MKDFWRKCRAFDFNKWVLIFSIYFFNKVHIYTLFFLKKTTYFSMTFLLRNTFCRCNLTYQGTGYKNWTKDNRGFWMKRKNWVFISKFPSPRVPLPRVVPALGTDSLNSAPWVNSGSFSCLSEHHGPEAAVAEPHKFSEPSCTTTAHSREKFHYSKFTYGEFPCEEKQLA